MQNNEKSCPGKISEKKNESHINVNCSSAVIVFIFYTFVKLIPCIPCKYIFSKSCKKKVENVK